jgi:hypothetical protein
MNAFLFFSHLNKRISEQRDKVLGLRRWCI